MPSKKKLKKRNKRLRERLGVEKYNHKLTLKDRRFWQSCVEGQDVELEKLEAEIAELKAPKFTVTIGAVIGNVSDMKDKSESETRLCLICENVDTTQFICTSCCDDNGLLNNIVKYLQRNS